ncbi:MAG: type II secretion system ATPase GspE [Deltaproteobacteria bacterium]|nr:type II secretion system ATPase GspE [Deltaproteobacteria bacterium]
MSKAASPEPSLNPNMAPVPLLGEILTESCGLSEKDLQKALQVQTEKGGRLGEILMRLKLITETDLLGALGVQWDLPVSMTLPTLNLDTAFTQQTPIQFLKKFKLTPLITRERSAIAMNDPSEFQALDDLRRILNIESAPVVLAPASAILSVINAAYDVSGDSAERVIEDMQEGEAGRILSEIEETADLLEDTSDAPVVKLVNLMLSQAVKARASDIHIEHSQHKLRIRYRVDGILYDMLSPPKHVQSALISRIKIMAQMNIAEKRLPQDGRIKIRIADKNIDIRVSTIPVAFGERVVLRLLDKTNVLLKVTDLGMPDTDRAAFEELIGSPHGIILVTGPTGSGKTTTLYAALSSINKTDINIITIEDPIEYQIDGIGQIQTNAKIDLTFAKGLRSIVRQDPDVILVGEVRDLETAEIAIQSALTGHLVFSTLHTNDSAGAVTRLIDMGIEPFLVTSSVSAILAQRLVRVICPQCREPYTPDDESLRKVGITKEMAHKATIYRGRGCSACLDTGFRGRTGIFEFMLLDEKIKNLILKTSDANAIKRAAIERGMTTLRRDGARKVLQGVTTIEEVFRVTYQ